MRNNDKISVKFVKENSKNPMKNLKRSQSVKNL